MSVDKHENADESAVDRISYDEAIYLRVILDEFRSACQETERAQNRFVQAQGAVNGLLRHLSKKYELKEKDVMNDSGIITRA